MNGAQQRVSLDLGEGEAADEREGDMLQRGGAKKANRMAKKGKSAKKAKGAFCIG